MITISEALDRVRQYTLRTSKTIDLPIEEALGYVLSENVISSISMPPFRQSAMDGYALNLHEASSYTVVGEIKAGDGEDPLLSPGEAVRIFTGAKVPNTANAIAIQEKVKVAGNHLTLDNFIKEGANIRPNGEQVQNGALAMKKNTLLNAAGIGFLASLGIQKVAVYQKPSIAIVVTGNELVTPGRPLAPGKIYESNSSMLKSLLRKLGYSQVQRFEVSDRYEETVKVLKEAIETHDFTIISGGISVGDYDYVGKALTEIGVTEHFYKVFQKPGKPLFYGTLPQKQIYALPGNPAATLTCFYIYVLLGLERFSGNEEFEIQRTKARASQTIEIKGDRPQFLKAIYRNGTVEILEGQNSSMLHTFSLANALVFKPETQSTITVNDKVEVLLLP